MYVCCSRAVNLTSASHRLFAGSHLQYVLLLPSVTVTEPCCVCDQSSMCWSVKCCCIQVCQLGFQLIWTRDVTEALRKSEVDRKVMSKTKQSILDLLNSVLGHVTINSSAVDRIKFESLATLQIYYKDTFSDLVS